MKGRITEYKRGESKGTITAFNSMRYSFSRSDWRSPDEPAAGLDVEFLIDGTSAKDVALRQARSVQTTHISGQPPEDTWAIVSPDMRFGDAIKICFQKSLTFSGRARRAEFWYFALFGLILNGVLIAMLASAGANPLNWRYAQLALRIALLLPSLAVTARRLHDRDHAGYWVLICVAPSIVFSLLDLTGLRLPFPPTVGFSIFISIVLVQFGTGIWIIVQTVMAGTFGPNRYGPDPLSPPESVP
jgi:uncharacterized membrane protein YhaH (DUF805 family)